jgi:hypothetical protein
LLEGPPRPVALKWREQYPWAASIRAISDGAAAVVLLESMQPGVQAAPHVALDLADRASRRVARALAAQYLTPHLVTPAIDRAIVTAPTATWLDGEYERLSRPVVERAERALRSLLATLGVTDDEPHRPPVRVVLKAIATLDAPGPGVAEPAVPPGALVRVGDVAAWVGAPGLHTRAAVHANATGVVLWARSGQLTNGPVMGIGKLRRALPSVLKASAPRHAASARGVDVGWCEHVALPELGVERLKAKIDTGARTSALHVIAMRPVGSSPSGRALLEVELAAGKKGRTRSARVEVVEWTRVRDSGGHVERRPVIETVLELGPVERRVRVSLTDRGDMLFPMLIGRTALGADFRVLPQRRFVLDRH